MVIIKAHSAIAFALFCLDYEYGMEWNRIVQMEGTPKDHQVQMPEHFRANPNIKHVTKSIIQMHLEHLSNGHQLSC